MRACPFPCPGYRPAPEAQRPEQEVPVLGREYYRGRTCPGAVVSEDPTVVSVLRDSNAMKQWAGGNSLEWFNNQPAWWSEGLREVRRMQDQIEDENRPHD